MYQYALLLIIHVILCNFLLSWKHLQSDNHVSGRSTVDCQETPDYTWLWVPQIHISNTQDITIYNINNSNNY